MKPSDPSLLSSPEKPRHEPSNTNSKSRPQLRWTAFLSADASGFVILTVSSRYVQRLESMWGSEPACRQKLLDRPQNSLENPHRFSSSSRPSRHGHRARPRFIRTEPRLTSQAETVPVATILTNGCCSNPLSHACSCLGNASSCRASFEHSRMRREHLQIPEREDLQRAAT